MSNKMNAMGKNDIKSKKSTNGDYYYNFKIAAILVNYKMVGLQNIRCHSKLGPFANQPLFDHLKSRQVWISDPHRITIEKGLLSLLILRKFKTIF